MVKHELAIVLAFARRLKGRTRDALTLVVLLPLLALFSRAWLARLPDAMRDLLTVGAASLVAMLVAKALVERLWFHRTDGVVARDAQRLQDGLAYFVPLILAAIMLALAVLALVGLDDPPSMSLGIACGLPTGLAFPFALERFRRWWRRIVPTGLRALGQIRFALAKAAALSAGIGILIASLPSERYLDGIAVGAYALIVILLTAPVDAGTVRYMTLVGHRAPTLLRHWLPIQQALLGPLTLVLVVAQAWLPATVAALVSLALPVVTALRIFAYRAFGRLIADWAVAVVIVAAAYAGFTVPPLGPAITIAGGFWLARRGERTRWLLA